VNVSEDPLRRVSGWLPRLITRADDEIAAANSPSSQMLFAIGATGKHLYQGTVPGHVKARRRARNKAARRARRAAR
jgi:hypothetical protein